MVIRGMTRRQALCGGLAGLALAGTPAGADMPVRITDMLGRSITLPARPQRMVLMDARDAVTIALLDPDPMRRIAGWTAPEVLDSDVLLAALKAQAGRDIPVVGGLAPGSVSVERIVSLRPDLVVTTRNAESSNGQIAEQLAAFRIPVVFSDSASSGAGRAGDDDLAALLRLWGRLLGREERAEDLLTFLAGRFAAVAACTAGAPTRKVYLEVQSTYDDCCWAAGRMVWGELLALAGGRNLDAATAPWFQKLHVEQLITEQPDVYVAAGGAFAKGTRPPIAPGLHADAARNGLAPLTARPGMDLLAAVRDGRVYGVWTGLVAIRPLNILFVERMAAWLHPDRCGAIRADQTLRELNHRFLSLPVEMPLWVSLSGS